MIWTIYLWLIVQRKLEHIKCQKYRKSGKKNDYGYKEPKAQKGHLRIVKKHFPAPPLSRANIVTAVRADIANFVADTDSEVPLQGRHSHLVIKILTAL